MVIVAVGQALGHGELQLFLAILGQKIKLERLDHGVFVPIGVAAEGIEAGGGFENFANTFPGLLTIRPKRCAAMASAKSSGAIGSAPAISAVPLSTVTNTLRSGWVDFRKARVDCASLPAP